MTSRSASVKTHALYTQEFLLATSGMMIEHRLYCHWHRQVAASSSTLHGLNSKKEKHMDRIPARLQMYRSLWIQGKKRRKINELGVYEEGIEAGIVYIAVSDVGTWTKGQVEHRRWRI
jgi:hypothetical protein